MHNVNYNHLFYFHTVASAGSQAAAARQLHVSQSTISEQVKLLEGMLSATLFDRTAGKMRLTSEGRKCLEFTQIMFNATERLLQAFEVHSTTAAVLEVGVAASVGRMFATRLLAPLLDDSELMPRVREGEFANLQHRLLRHELDLLVSEVRPRGEVTSLVALELNFIFVAVPTLAARIESVPADLGGKPMVRFPEGSPYRFAIDHHLHRHGAVPDVVMETDDLDLMLLAVRKGRGAAALPEQLVRPFVAEGTLESLGAVGIEAQLYLSYANASPTEFVQRAIELLAPGQLGPGASG